MDTHVNNANTYAICPRCGAQVEVDPAQEAAICRFCDNPFATSEAISAYRERHIGVSSDHSTQETAPKSKQKRHTLLWVLGWLFCFPIPLTILMHRNKILDRRLRYGIIIAAWMLYVVLGVIRYRSLEVSKSQVHESEEVSSSLSFVSPSPTEVPVSTQPSASVTVSPSSPQAVFAEPERPSSPPALEQIPGVSSEFKAAMDSYEAFFDEYVKVMQEFSENPSDLGVLMQYTEFMTQYTETMESLNAIDETELTPEEDAYYIEVMARINAKLFEAAQYMSQE